MYFFALSHCKLTVLYFMPHRFKVRIEAIVLREEFCPSCAVMSREIDVVRIATKGNSTCALLPTHTHTHHSHMCPDR